MGCLGYVLILSLIFVLTSGSLFFDESTAIRIGEILLLLTVGYYIREYSVNRKKNTVEEQNDQ